MQSRQGTIACIFIRMKKSWYGRQLEPLHGTLQGDFIKLLCADDLIHETLLAREVEIMERYPEANLVQTDTRFVDMHGKTTGYYKRYHASGLVEGRKACRFSAFTRDYLGHRLPI